MATGVSPDFTADLAQARDRAEAAQREQFEAGQEASQENDIYSDEAEQKQTAQHDKDIAEGDFRQTREELHQRDEGVHSAQQGIEREDHDLAELRRQIQQSSERIGAMERKAADSHEVFLREFGYQVERDKMSCLGEIFNNYEELKRVDDAIRVKLYARMMGVSLNVDTTFNRVRYLEPTPGRTDPSQSEYSQLQLERDNLASQERALQQRENDPYFSNVQADAIARRDKTAEEHALNEKADRDAKAAFESAKAVVQGARDEAREAERKRGEAGLDVGKANREVEEVEEKRRKAERDEDRRVREAQEAARHRQPGARP